MLIRKIKLHPFAGVNNFETQFQSGLNVIQGPNEAGKSTIVRAIQFAFFSPAKSPKKERDKISNEFFPKSGGDTIRITIEFSVQGRVYTLKRSWGGTDSANLSGNDIGEITDSESVATKLGEFLVLNQASWENILFSHQAVLGQTFNRISESQDIKGSLSDILRSSVISSGGISIENFKNSLADKIIFYYSNWNMDLNRPRDGREIDNKWKVKVGFILSAYYEFKQAEQDLQVRNDYDDQIDQYSKQITEFSFKINSAKEFVDKHKPIVDDARKRLLHLEKKKIKNLELSNLATDAEQWEKHNASLPARKQLLALLEENIDNLKKELDIANRKEGIKSRKDKLKKAEELELRIIDTKSELKKQQKVNDEDLNNYEKLKDEIHDLKIKIESQKLKYEIKSKSNIDGLLEQGIGEKKSIKFIKGEAFSGLTDGKIKLETSEVIISVESANENVTSMLKKINDKKSLIEKLNKKYDVPSFAQLKKLYDRIVELKSKIETEEDHLDQFLDEDEIDKLRKEIRNIDNLPSTRTSKKISEEIEVKGQKCAELKFEIKNFTVAIEKFEKKYKSLKTLKEAQVTCGVDLRLIENEIAGLEPLPPEVKNLDALIKEYDAKKDEYDNLRESLSDIRVEKAKFQAEEPAFTAEEIIEKIAVSKRDYELKLKEGKAYQKISNALNNALNNETQDVFQPFAEKLCSYFAKLTAGKYSKIVTEDILPITVKNDKVALPIELLSKGTKDVLALAQKLAMAGYYLQNSSGFLVLDDPLTDLDPSRKSAAVNVISDFAKEKQLIIFTCDPVHAKMFNIKEIQLN